MILDLARQGLTVSAIARRTGHDRKTIRKYIERGLEPPVYTPRPPAASPLAPFEAFLRERVARFPDLTGRRLWREIRELGFPGGYSTVTDFLRTVRPASEPAAFERRFETPPGRQAQVDFAYFKLRFEDEPSTERIVWPFSMVLGHSRMMWARFVAQQDLATVLRCHVAAFEALGGVPGEILYDRMRTAALGEVDDRGIVYNDKLLALAAHYGFVPRACRPYRAKTKGKVERPFRYVREDFFLARTLLPLPPKCPEHNVMENVRQFMRDNWLSNRVFRNHDDIVAHCCHHWTRLVDQPWRIMSTRLRDWAHGF